MQNPFFTIPAFYPKAVDVFIRQVFWLVLFNASFPKAINAIYPLKQFGKDALKRTSQKTCLMNTSTAFG